MLDFGTAVTSVLTQYATFTGRARRSEYWWFALASVLASVVASVLDVALTDAAAGAGLFSLVLTLALFLPSLAVGVRRLHDTGRSGWWMLISLTIIGIIVLIVFFVQDSQPGPNQHGPSPKYQAAGGSGY